MIFYKSPPKRVKKGNSTKNKQKQNKNKTKMKECSPFLFQKSIFETPNFSIFLYDNFENLL